MPTLGAHFSDDEAAVIELAAAASPEGKVSPYVGEAIRRRLKLEGLLPGSKDEDVAKLTAKVAAAVRKDPALADRIEAVIGKSTRRMVAA